MTLDLIRSIEILTFGGFVLQSNVGPMNTNHQVSDVMLTFGDPHIKVTYVCFIIST